MSESFEDARPMNGEIRSVSDEAGSAPDLKRARRSRAATAGHIDRLPPHSPEAEQGVLGCALLSPKDCVAQIITKLRGKSEVFYDLRHATIFDALMAMSSLNVEIDVITLQQWLKDDNLLDQIGGIPYLNSLQDCVPSAANLSYYLEIILEKYLARKAIYVCTDTVGKIYDYEGDIAGCLDEVERDILQIRGDFRTSESSGMKELVAGSLERIEMLWRSRGQSVIGIATGFVDLDRMTGGLRNGDIFIIAARPSLGKTSLALNIAEYVSVTNGIPVGVFSLEMTKESLTDRMVSSRARVNLRSISEGFMADADFPGITNAAGKISSSPLRIDDTPGLSIMELRARARTMSQQYGIKLFVVDYLQLMQSTTKRAKDNRQLEVSEISSGLKSLAKELSVPVIVLSQLNRDIEKTKRKPLLSDLRESGSIEQDADIVGFLYKPAYDDEEAAEEVDGWPINLKIAKQRNGPTGEVPLTFLRGITRFESAAKVSDDDVPTESDQQTFPATQPQEP